MAETPSLAVGPPLEYRLDKASIRLTREFGHGMPIRQVNLAGAGDATLERGGQRWPFHYPPTDLLALLNELYRLRFFNLPASYTTQYSIFLKDDGMVGTSALRKIDAASTTLCFTVPTYEKCVRFNETAPRELEEIARRIFSEADRLVKQSSSE